MKWTWVVGTLWGTEIRLHASMLLLIPYTFFAFRPTTASESVRALLFMAATFVCVLLHELGHTGAARIFGIEVENITLWPLGGIASLSRTPEKIWQNIIVVAAGPLVNLVLAAFFALLLLLERILLQTLAFPALSSWLYTINFSNFGLALAIVNAALFLFNIIPMYPLDGGRIALDVLKAIFGENRASTVMLIISLPLALVLAVIGLFTLDFVLLATGLLLAVAAASLNQRASRQISNNALFFTNRAGYYQRNEDYDQALKEFTRQIDQNPTPAAYVNRALVYQNLLEPDLARADIERALEVDDKNAVAWCLKGELTAAQEDYASALRCFNLALKYQPGGAVGLADRGSVRIKLGNTSHGLADMDQAVELGKSNGVMHLLRSIARFRTGDRAGAMQDADVALHFAPEWLLTLPPATVDGLRGEMDWAMAYYNLAVERFPNAYQAYQGRGDVLRVNNRLSWALEDYHRAIRLAPKVLELFLARGEVYLELGQMEKAHADFQLALASKKGHIRRQATQKIARMRAK